MLIRSRQPRYVALLTLAVMPALLGFTSERHTAVIIGFPFQVPVAVPLPALKYQADPVRAANDQASSQQAEGDERGLLPRERDGFPDSAA